LVEGEKEKEDVLGKGGEKGGKRRGGGWPCFFHLFLQAIYKYGAERRGKSQ